MKHLVLVASLFAGAAQAGQFQNFIPTQWDGTLALCGCWRIALDGTLLGEPVVADNASIIESLPPNNVRGFAKLTVNSAGGSAVESTVVPFGDPTPRYFHGYYEVRAQTGTDVFAFTWQDPKFHHIGFWIIGKTFSFPGTDVTLGFDPSKGLHKYGFLWHQLHVDYTVDRHIVGSQHVPINDPGQLIVQVWGNQAGTSYVDWVRYIADAVVVPPPRD
jgi:hypothetical protein